VTVTATAKATGKESAVQAAKGKAASKSVERSRRGEPSGRWLGMKLEAVTGIRVSDVASESVAERYGLKPGDVLLSVDGRPLTRVDELMAAVRENRRPVLSFTVLRGGKTFRMLVDAQPVMTQAAEVPAAAESRAIRVGSKSFSNELGGIVLVRSSANGPVSFSAVFRDADGATRSLQFTGEPLDLLERVAVLPESLRRVVVEWLR
jgi:predicted metalloprotease with PDZ domain